MIGSIWLVTKIRQQANDTGFFEIENVAVYIRLGMAFINASVKLITPGKQLLNSTSSSPAAMKNTDYENSTVAQKHNKKDHLICRRNVKTVKIPATLLVPEVVRAPPTEPQIIETHPQLTR